MKTYIKIKSDGYAVFKDLELPFVQRPLDKIIKDEDEVPENYILAYEYGGFHHPRWDGTQWIEGLTQKEINELGKPQATEPSFEELQIEYNVDLDYRLSLIEMGLI